MDLLKYIVKNSASGPVDVLAMGKEAAAAFSAGEGSLNSLIIKRASVQRLNRQQIDRVCEVANNATFASKFQSSDDKNVTFPLADAVKIAHAVKRAPNTDMQKEAVTAPARPVGRINADIDLERELFGDVMDKEKTAEAITIGELEESLQRTATKGQLLHLNAEKNAQLGLMKEAMYNFTEQAFQLVASGDYGYPDIQYALASEIGDEHFIKQAMAYVHNEVRRRYGGMAMPRGLYKRANAYMTDPGHPLVQHAQELLQAAEAYAAIQQRMDNLLAPAPIPGAGMPSQPALVPGAGMPMRPQPAAPEGETNPLVSALAGGRNE